MLHLLGFLPIHSHVFLLLLNHGTTCPTASAQIDGGREDGEADGTSHNLHVTGQTARVLNFPHLLPFLLFTHAHDFLLCFLPHNTGKPSSSTQSVGLEIGDSIGDEVGDALGDAVGDALGDAVGDAVGDALGDAVGDALGEAVGIDNLIGEAVGGAVGDALGVVVGDALGEAVGETLGDTVGEALGEAVGDPTGDTIGDAVGDALGEILVVHRGSVGMFGSPPCW
jgi:hypothetical protein